MIEVTATATVNASDVALAPVASILVSNDARQVTAISVDTGSATPVGFWEAGARYRVTIEKCN